MILAYVLSALIVVHTLGALRHHFFKRNDVMRRMLYGGRPAPVDAAPTEGVRRPL
jgi:cytochrome b561